MLFSSLGAIGPESSVRLVKCESFFFLRRSDPCPLELCAPGLVIILTCSSLFFEFPDGEDRVVMVSGGQLSM